MGKMSPKNETVWMVNEKAKAKSTENWTEFSSGIVYRGAGKSEGGIFSSQDQD